MFSFESKIVDAKITDEKITLDWYKKYFLSKENDKNEIAIYSLNEFEDDTQYLRHDSKGNCH